MNIISQTSNLVSNSSPREFQSDKIPEDKVARIKEIYNIVSKKLDSELGREANFNDFISNQVEKFGYEKIDASFEGLKYAWNAIGRDISDSDIVYRKYFEDSNGLLTAIDQIDKHNSQNNLATCEICNSIKVNNSADCIRCIPTKDHKLNEIINSETVEKDKSVVYLFAFGFIWVLGSTGALGLLRYIISPEIPTWLILSILFIGFIVVWKIYFEKK